MDTILFDLDGTLLPMNTDSFVEIYLGALAQKMAQYGFAPQQIPPAVWKGSKAMAANHGKRTNEEIFWESFAQELGETLLPLKPELELFYENEFHAVRAATQPNPLVPALLAALRQKGYTLVLATNPMFPHNAVQTRLGWIGLSPKDFTLVTSYECCSYCKPNPGYYTEILAKLGKQPADCLMVGNDFREDGCAAALGMDFYLVTDNLLNPTNQDISIFKNGDFAACHQYLLALPALYATTENTDETIQK